MSTELSEISIVILPFEDLTKSEESALFCKSFTDDLIVDFSYFRQYNIISGQTAVSIRQNGEIDYQLLDNLGVEYYLLGAFRQIDTTVRINAQLYHYPTNRLVWANRFEKGFEEMLTLQTSIVEEITAALQTHVTVDISKRIRKKSELDFKSYELFVKGLEEVKKGTPESDLKARDFFRQALDRDPHFSLAYSGMSLTYFNEWSCQIWSKWDISKSEAFQWAKKSIEQDEQNYFAALVIGRVLLYERSFESAEYFLNKSFALNNNDPETLAELASCFLFLNNPEFSKELINRAMRLNNAGAEKYYAIATLIYFELGEFERARSFAQKVINFNWVDGNAYFAALYYFLGDHSEMERRWKMFLEVFSEKIMKGKDFNTRIAIDWIMEVNPYRSNGKIHEFLRIIDGGLSIHNAQPESPLPESAGIFRKNGEEWEFQYGGSKFTLPEVKGFSDILRLLENPGKEFHCKEIMGSMIEEPGVESADEKARKNYQERIREIQAELEEADAHFDIERVKELHEEYDRLIDHLSKTFDKQGRARRQKDGNDKIRSAVTWRIRSAISRIEKQDPALGKHLSNSIRTGTYCSYSPENSITWN